MRHKRRGADGYEKLVGDHGTIDLGIITRRVASEVSCR